MPDRAGADTLKADPMIGFRVSRSLLLTTLGLGVL